MNPLVRTWKGRALGLAALVTLSGCTVAGEGYVGAVYEPVGYDYAWQTGYYVAPPRHGYRVEHHDDRHDEHRGGGGSVQQVQPVQPQRAQSPPPARAYRPAPAAQLAPSIPTRPAPPGHLRIPPGHEKTPPGHEKH